MITSKMIRKQDKMIKNIIIDITDIKINNEKIQI